MAKAHSSLIGGSTADRLLNCPGSWAAIMALPPSADIPSSYAEEGSFYHSVMDHLARIRQQQPNLDVEIRHQARSYFGQPFHDRVLTEEHLAGGVVPALDMQDELEAAYGGNFEILGIEEEVEFPGVPSAFGTVDLLLGNKDYVILADFKFGTGIPVQAVYDDGQGALCNPQLMFYLAGAMNSLPKIFAGKRKLVIAIMQPRIEDGLSHTVVTRKEVRTFIKDVHNAITLALGRDPPLHRGEHCRWCPAKVCCPKWTAPVLNLSSLGLHRKPATISKEPTPYGDYLAKAKALIDGLVMMKKDIDEQITSYLEDGGLVPGWKLKAKRTNRKWVDEAVVVPALEALGFEQHEIWQRNLQTFTIADGAAKRHGVKIPEHLRIAPPSTETTLAAIDDPAPAVLDRDTVVQQFQQALKRLNVG